MSLFAAWSAGINNPRQRVGLTERLALCPCGNEIAAYELGSGKRIGLGCVRRGLAAAGFPIGTAIR